MIMESLQQLLETSLHWPAFPFTILLSLCVGYWCLLLLSGIDLDVFDLDVDLDIDGDVDASLADWGMMGVKWFNLGDVPLMLWVSLLALASWMVSVFYDQMSVDASSWDTAMIVARNFGIGLISAKILTQPLKGKLKHKEPNTLAEMIGRSCTVISAEVTPTSGNAICHVNDGAPLQLNVRTQDGNLAKDSIVTIVDFIPDNGTYIVAPLEAPT